MNNVAFLGNVSTHIKMHAENHVYGTVIYNPYNIYFGLEKLSGGLFSKIISEIVGRSFS